MPIKEFHVASVYEGMGLDHDQFVDLCILLGCDYVDKIRGIGPKKAIELVTITLTHFSTFQYLIFSR